MINQKKKLIWLAIGCGGLFLILTWLVLNQSAVLHYIDNSVVAVVRFQPTVQLQKIMWAISWLSSPTLIFMYSVILIVTLGGLRGFLPAIWAGMTMLSGALLVKLIKNSVQRPRPMGHGSIGGFSFPSGHTFGVALFCLTVTSIMALEFKSSRHRLLNCLLVLWVIMIAISRIYLRAHFPTDTVGSVLLATTWIVIARSIYPFLNHLKKSE
ncbi:phosphatase PAP2 family protein [Dellaglioa sp. BT-FLS60]